MPERRRSPSLVDRARRALPVVVGATVIATALVSFSGGAAAEGTVHLQAAVNGQPAATSSDAHPAEIYPDRPAQIRVRVLNGTDSVVRVSTVRFDGQVLDLPLFSYDTAVNLTVAPGAASAVTFPVNMSGIGNLATGLIVATVTLIGSNGYTIASQSLVTKVHGSLFSIYGLFGLAVLALTLLSLALAVLMLVRGRLPQNRWFRGIRFFVPGFGVGLVLTFTLAAAGLTSPGPGHWLAFLVIPSAVGLAAGFLTPAPDEEEYDDYDEDVLLAEIVMVDDDPLDEEVRAGEMSEVVRPSGVPPAVPDSRATAAP